MSLTVSTSSLLTDLHLQFIKQLDDHADQFEYWAMEHLRMNAIYWSMTTLHLLKGSHWESYSPLGRQEIMEFVLECQNDDGGFGGNVNMESHVLFTLSAIQILFILKELSSIDTDQVVKYILSLQLPDGSFKGDKYGEIDNRFSYAAISALRLLGSLDTLNLDLALSFIMKCQNPDGGFGAVPGAESHAGQSTHHAYSNLVVFCCLGALKIAEKLSVLPKRPELIEWLCFRQLPCGGFNGRPEKLEDVCYSWWVLTSISVLESVDCINGQALIDFILNCQDDENGGIADRPGDIADVFHTLFGITGLSLLNYPGINAVDPSTWPASHKMSDEELVVVKRKRGGTNIIVGAKQSASIDAEDDKRDVKEAEVKKVRVEKREEVVISGELAEELLAEEKTKMAPSKPAITKEIAQKEKNAAPKKMYAIPKHSVSEPVAKSEKFQFNPDNAKPTCRFDYAKDLCKDYNESGYCVFGDTCIFLHDRGDYKSGWELELDWNKQVKADALAKQEVLEEEDEEEDQNICKVCGKERTAPVSAECGHIFCEACALTSFSTSKRCPVCKKPWKGSFKVVK